MLGDFVSTQTSSIKESLPGANSAGRNHRCPVWIHSPAQFLLPAANTATQTCQRRQNVSYIPCGRNPPPRNDAGTAPNRTGTRRLSRTSSARNVTRKSINNSIESEASLQRRSGRLKGSTRSAVNSAAQLRRKRHNKQRKKHTGVISHELWEY